MAKLQWDKVGERFYETGVDHGVLYVQDTDASYKAGVNWDGLTSVDESPEGGEANDIYADNIKYLSLISAENFKYTINAYQSPEEFDICDGTASLATGIVATQQSRRAFGFSYRTRLGNDVEGDDYGYVLHLVYGSKCAPSQKTRSTVNDNPEATELSWEVNTTPAPINAIDPSTRKQYKPTAHIMINSKLVSDTILTKIENLLYGTDGSEDPTYNAVVDPKVDTYDAVTPAGSESPSDRGWYERSGSGTEMDPYVYTLSEDTEVDAGKTYYVKTPGDNPHALNWYERSGEEGSYVYTLSEDTTVDLSKTYYTQTPGTGSDPTLPTPDEIMALINS